MTLKYVHLTHKNSACILVKLKECLDDVQKCMFSSNLKLSPDNLGYLISPALVIKKLVALFDSYMSFTSHVQSVCKLCFIHLRDLKPPSNLGGSVRQ